MPSVTSAWSNSASFALAALLVLGCGRVKREASAPEEITGGAGQAAMPDARGGSFGGGNFVAEGGSVALAPPDASAAPAEASAPAAFPYPFDSRNCRNAPPSDGAVHCVTRAELAGLGLPKLLVAGGVESLGTDTAWRCPELNEIDFSRHCECCNEDAWCGPVVEHVPFDAGLPIDAATGEQLCCYYTVTTCLV